MQHVKVYNSQPLELGASRAELASRRPHLWKQESPEKNQTASIVQARHLFGVHVL